MNTEFTQVERLMVKQENDANQIKLFRKLYEGFVAQKNTQLNWDEISSPDEQSILSYDELEAPGDERAKKLLDKLAICRLNGGLGTSMGCIGPKSAIEVRDNMSFLDLIVTQIRSVNQRYKSKVPLVLMNSHNTDQDTKKIIKKYVRDLQILTFDQSWLPRLRRDSLMPVSKQKLGSESCYPPGHGDFYDSFPHSGILDQLLEEGKEWLFIANADNLGASIDLNILSYMEQTNCPFVMEVTAKTRSDVKGGTLVKTPEHALTLLEMAQVPKIHREEFKSVKKFKIFNTNNVWLNLRALKEQLEAGGLEREVLLNKKTIQGLPIIQLETALGGVIQWFEGAKAIQVPRSRFLPVKKTDDLLLVQSNLFEIQEGVLVRNPLREFENLPMIRLGEYFKDFEAYQARIEEIPDLLDLDLLTVVGDIWFGRDIQLKGNVILVCDQGRLHLPRGTCLENQVLTGNIELGEL